MSSTRTLAHLVLSIAFAAAVMSFMNPSYEGDGMSFESAMQVKAHTSCAKAPHGMSKTTFMTLVGPAKVHMTWDRKRIPHPDYCEPDTELGSTCMVGTAQVSLASCTWEL